MKLPLAWLKDYIDPKLSTEALVERLTMAGLEVEAVESFAGDIVLEIEITPNRSDLLSILGLAREISAITGKPFKTPPINKHKTTDLKNLIHIEDKKDCSRYIATLIRQVEIKDAPAQMKKRVASAGINAINNAVDITNFVLMETGQPLHAFDYDKLAGGKIRVRRARAGESIVTLDGVERKLDTSILVIADDEKPVAIAGVMGGKGTEITSATKNILLESAHFDMGLIRRASRSLSLCSDSSYRFERNVNLDGVLTGAQRATDLLLQMTGGQLAGRAEILSKMKNSMPKIKIKSVEIESVLGMTVTPQKIRAWLTKLGFKITAKAGTFTVVPPPNRADINHDVDVIEEIARMVGFDHMPSQMPVIKSSNISVDKRPREIKENVRRLLTAGGVDEAITFSMVSGKDLAKTRMVEMPVVRLINPLSQEQELMRPGLLPSFLQVVATNFNRGHKDLRFFEIGKTYSKEKEQDAVGILLTGRRSRDWRSPKREMVDIFDLKGLLEPIFQETGLKAIYQDAKVPAFDPACSAFIIVNGKPIGIMARVEQAVLNNWDIKNQDIYYAAFYLDALFSSPRSVVKYQPISGFPAITRDVSLAVKKEIPYEKIEAICKNQGGEILKSVQFIEQYLGDKIQPGCKGLVFSCLYQSNTRTLREDEVTSVHERILQALTRDLTAVRR